MEASPIDIVRLSPFFDAGFYEVQVNRKFLNPDAALAHYLGEGHELGASPSADFDGQAYWRAYPDVEKVGMNPLRHYVLHGRSEGRETFALARTNSVPI